MPGEKADVVMFGPRADHRGRPCRRRLPSAIAQSLGSAGSRGLGRQDRPECARHRDSPAGMGSIDGADDVSASPSWKSCRASASATTIGRQMGGRARHRRHQHAGRADRGGGRYRARPAALHGPRNLPRPNATCGPANGSHADYPLTAELRDRTVGIVGMGRIGQAIARALAAFGAGRLLSPHARKRTCPIAIRPGRPCARRRCPASSSRRAAPATRPDRRRGARGARPEGILINVARGSVVDEPALVAALKDKTSWRPASTCSSTSPRCPS